MDSGTVLYFDADGKMVRETTWKDVFAAVDRVKAFFASVGQRFVERDDVIRRLMFAMLMREHVLLIGKSGNAKTALVNCIMQNIEGAKLFEISMSRDRQKNELLGPWSLKRLRADEGYFHMTEGYLPEAHLARLGEFFDGGDGLLRDMLDILNERKLNNGPQQVRMPLMTAFADTNFAPEHMPSRMAQLEAVVDRFLFRIEVHSPKDRISDYHMVESSLEGAQRAPITPLALQDLVLVSGVVVAMNLVQDRYVKEAYVDIVRGVSEDRQKQGRGEISPRRKTWAAQCMEVPALLMGRNYVTMDDLRAARYGLTAVPEDEDLFNRHFEHWRTHWIERSKRHEVEQELHVLGTITQSLPEELDLSNYQTGDLKKMMGDLFALRASVDGFEATCVEAHDLKLQRTRKIDEHLLAVKTTFIGKLEARLPSENLDQAELGELGRMKQLTTAILTELHAIPAQSSQVRDAKAAVIAKALQINADIETNWTVKTGAGGVSI